MTNRVSTRLFFTFDFTWEPTRWTLEAATRQRARSVKTKRFETQSHDLYILAAMRNELKNAARTVSAKTTFRFSRCDGDISTTANSRERFAFAHSSHRKLHLRDQQQDMRCWPQTWPG